MIQLFLERALNVSSAELPRVLYGWALRFIFSFGEIIGWTVVIAVAVSRFSIETLPIVFLGRAIFTIIGMMFFSVLIDRITARQILALNSLFAGVTLFAAFYNFSNGVVFLILALIASGMFLSQISIIISNYLEDFFTPREAERVVPLIESSETIGGILGGILLATLPFSELSGNILFIWIGTFGLFVALLYAFQPRLPFYLRKLDEESHEKYKPRFNWNAIVKSVSEIRRVPFLQILLTVLIFHWVIAHFIEFLYTKAVDESVHVVNEAEHGASLVHGLGALHIFLHGSALMVELFVSSKVLKALGNFAGFMVHVVLTLLSSISLLFGFGFTTAVLARNNFEMTTIIQRNAYETAYYAFRYGTLRSLREFFEGVVYPGATIIGTLLIIGIEHFFLEGHLMYVIPFMLVSLTLGMGLFALQLQKRFTEMTVQNLYSSIPIAQHHAVEIISQKGHGDSFEHLARLFQKYDDVPLKKKVLSSIAALGNVKAAEFLLEVACSGDAFSIFALKALVELGGSLRRTKASDAIRGPVSTGLQSLLEKSPDENVQLLALKGLAQYDPRLIEQYLDSPRPILQAEAAVQLWQMNLHKRKIRRLVHSFLKAGDKDAYRALAHMVGSIPLKQVKGALMPHHSSDDDELRLLSLYCLVKSNHFRELPTLMNLLLYGNEVIFTHGIQLIQRLNVMQKRKVAHALMPIAQLEQLPRTKEGKLMLDRAGALYEACDAYDEKAYLSSLVPVYSAS